MTAFVAATFLPMKAAMTGAEQLSRSVDDRLAEIIHQIANARDAFTTELQHAGLAVSVKLEQLRARASTRCAQFQRERDRVNSKVKRELAHAREKVQSWRETGQSEKLRRYADQAERYALAALLNADEALDVALIAAMESLEARLIYDATQKPRYEAHKPTRSRLSPELP